MLTVCVFCIPGFSTSPVSILYSVFSGKKLLCTYIWRVCGDYGKISSIISPYKPYGRKTYNVVFASLEDSDQSGHPNATLFGSLHIIYMFLWKNIQNNH